MKKRGWFVADCVVALLFYMVECAHIGNILLKRSKSFFPVESNICFPGQYSQVETIRLADTAKFRF